MLILKMRQRRGRLKMRISALVEFQLRYVRILTVYSNSLTIT